MQVLMVTCMAVVVVVVVLVVIIHQLLLYPASLPAAIIKKKSTVSPLQLYSVRDDSRPGQCAAIQFRSHSLVRVGRRR